MEEEGVFIFDLNYHGEHSFKNSNDFYNHILDHLFEYENNSKIKINYITFTIETTEEYQFEFLKEYATDPRIKIIEYENYIYLSIDNLKADLFKITKLENFIEFRSYDYNNPNHRIDSDLKYNEHILERYSRSQGENYLSENSFRRKYAYLIDKHKFEFKYKVYPNYEIYNKQEYTNSFPLIDIHKKILYDHKDSDHIKIIWGGKNFNAERMCEGEFTPWDVLNPYQKEIITSKEMLEIELKLLVTTNEDFKCFILDIKN